MSRPQTTTSRWPRVGTILVILLVGIVLRLALVEYRLQGVAERLPDSDLYEAYARQIFHGLPYDLNGDRALRTPGYPAFLALVWSIVGEPSTRAVLYAQAILASITGLVVYRIGRWFEWNGAPPITAIAALLIATFEPYGLLLGTLELSETLFAFLLTLAGSLYFRMLSQPGWTTSIPVGVVAGLAILVRPSILALVPIVAVITVLTARSQRPILLHTLVAGVGCLMVLAPWWIRNARIYDTLVLTTLNVGESLYDGWNPNADGSSNMSFKNDPAVIGMNEIERDRYWRSSAIAWAQAHPAEVVRLVGRKNARFWSPWPNEPRYQTWSIVLPTSAFTIPVYLFALVGLWQAMNQRGSIGQFVAVSLVPILYFAGIHSVFVSSVRYRAVAMPLFALLAGYGIARLVRQR